MRPAERSAPAPECGIPGSAPRLATAADIEPLTKALAAAFYDDPIFAWLMPRASSRHQRLERFYAVELDHVLEHGTIWTTEDEVGAALVLPPGRWRVPARVAVRFEPAVRGHVLRALRLLTAGERRHLREPHYYVAHIGVEPGQQGRGLGGALMRPTLDRCDRECLPAYLEASSERNAALYARLGFELTGVLRIAGSPPLRLMRRPPIPVGCGA